MSLSENLQNLRKIKCIKTGGVKMGKWKWISRNRKNN